MAGEIYHIIGIVAQVPTFPDIQRHTIAYHALVQRCRTNNDQLTSGLLVFCALVLNL